MPDLRVLTWNSSGEADGRGAQLALVTNLVNGAAAAAGNVPVQLVTIQEAANAPGSISAALNNGPPFNVFVQPEGFCSEYLPPPAQPFRVGNTRSYRIAWLVNDPAPANNLVAVGAPALVNLDPNNDAGVNGYINGLGFAPGAVGAVRTAAGNMRWPVYQRFTYAGCNVHFFTWHASLRASWLGANYTGLNYLGFPEGFLFFQNSTFYNNIVGGLGGNDVIIIAGDLNITQAQIANPAFFAPYVGVTANLTHIIAHCPTGAAVNQNVAYMTPFPPHTILTARVQW